MQSLLLRTLLLFALASPTQSFAYDPSEEADLIVRVFTEYCVGPILNEKPVRGWIMRRLDKDTATSMHANSTGRAWQAFHSNITLNEIRSPNGSYKGCHVEWESGLHNQFNLDFERAVASFDAWATESVKSEKFIRIKRCDSSNSGLIFVLESRTDLNRAVLVVMNYLPHLDYLFFFAVESGKPRPPENCSGWS